MKPSDESAPERDPLFDIQQAASVTECTGVLPAQVETKAQADAVSRLESIHSASPPKKKKKDKRKK